MTTTTNLSAYGLALDRLGNAKANPNKNQYDLLIWFMVNSILIFFIITMLTGNSLFSWLVIAMSWITSKYVYQMYLFIAIIGIDVVIMLLIKNTNVINGGLFSVITYYIIDYFYLSTDYTDFSLIFTMNN